MNRRIVAIFAVILGLFLAPGIMPAPVEAVTVNISIGTNLSSGRGIRSGQ